MIELPEARTITKDLRKELVGKKIVDVRGNFTDHKFTFYYKDPNDYKKFLQNKHVTNLIDRNYYVELEVEDYKILYRDGANIRYYENGNALKDKSKLLLEFEDGSLLNVTTSMYSFISIFQCGKEFFDDKYYSLELTRLGPFDPAFTFNYFQSMVDDHTSKLSLKAFLATEQRILGIGNGVVQDILFQARLNPKRKLQTLSLEELKSLYDSVIRTLDEMTKRGGRNTEKNVYGEFGGYETLMSSKTYKEPCPICHGEIKKETYLGGSIYYCPSCQK